MISEQATEVIHHLNAFDIQLLQGHSLVDLELFIPFITQTLISGIIIDKYKTHKHGAKMSELETETLIFFSPPF